MAHHTPDRDMEIEFFLDSVVDSLTEKLLLSSPGHMHILLSPHNSPTDYIQEPSPGSDTSSDEFKTVKPTYKLHDRFCFICHKGYEANQEKLEECVKCSESKCSISFHSHHSTSIGSNNQCPDCVLRKGLKDGTVKPRLDVAPDALFGLLQKLQEYLDEAFLDDIKKIDTFLEETYREHVLRFLQRPTFDGIKDAIFRKEYESLEQVDYDFRVIEHNLHIAGDSEFIEKWTEIKPLIMDELDYMATCHFCYLNWWNSDDSNWGFHKPCAREHAVCWVYLKHYKVWWPAKVYGREKNETNSYPFKYFCKELKLKDEVIKVGPKTVQSYSSQPPKLNCNMEKKQFYKEYKAAIKMAGEYLTNFKNFKLPAKPRPFSRLSYLEDGK